LILAVSDGHGSNKCFRSHVGADFAVHTATTLLKQLLEGQPDLTNLSAIKRTAEERLPQGLVREWRKAVEEHLTQNPFTDEEWQRLAEKESPAVRQTVESNPALAYGATILTTLIADDFVLYLQLGDGEILTVSDTGEVSRPMPKDERLMANETTSLCGPDAWRDFRIEFSAVSASPPALILLSTDGYPNSFRDEDGFLKVGADFLDMIRTDGLEKVNSNLETWLAEASQSGSGDDVTVGIAKRLEEKDIDSILRRITACETEIKGKDEQKNRIEEQGKRLEGVENSLEEVKQGNQKILGRISKLLFGVVVASLLGVAGIVTAVALGGRSVPAFPEKPTATAASTVDRPASERESAPNPEQPTGEAK
jgi:hypothetical protein